MEFRQFQLCEFAPPYAPIPNGKCFVYLTGGSTLAQLYDSAGSTISNPAIASGLAQVGFAVADGVYDLQPAYPDGTPAGPRWVKQGFFDTRQAARVLLEAPTIPQRYYLPTDPDFQSAMDRAVADLKSKAVNAVAGICEGSSRLFVPANTMSYDMHAPVDLTHTLIVEGDDTGFHDGHATKFKWTAGTCGFRVQNVDTAGDTGTVSNTFGGAGSKISKLFLKGGLDLSSTEGEFHAILGRARCIVENVGIDGWQGDGIAITADVSAASKGEASLSQISTCRIINIRNGVVPLGGDSNVIKIESVDVVYARRWAFKDKSFLATGMRLCHAAGCGFFNPGYTPSLCSASGNTYAAIDGMEAGASVNPPSGTTAHNAYWRYCYAGGPSVPLNILAWTSGMAVASGGGFLVTGASAATNIDACYTETGMGPSQLPYLAQRNGGTHGSGVMGASFGAHNGMTAAVGAISIEGDDFNSTIRTTIGSGEDTADRCILAHHNSAIGGANVLGLGFPSFSPNVLYWSNWRGSFSDDLVPFQISMNGASSSDAPQGPNRMNFPAGYGNGGKKRIPVSAVPGSGTVNRGDMFEMTGAAAAGKAGAYVTTAGTLGSTAVTKPCNPIDA